jgi:pimeloyl-ACP methyl ester carboxylesterase
MTDSNRPRQNVSRHPFRFSLPPDDVVRGDAWVPDSPVTGTAIVVLHGFKGFKDWGFFPYVCEEIAAQTGSVTVSFNCTGCGVGDSLDQFDELDRFASNTFTRELQDLEAVLDRLSAGRLGDLQTAPAHRFGLLGHSRGGAISLLAASRRIQVRALVTWNSVASLTRYAEMHAAKWEAGETVYILNARTGQQMPLARNLMDDVRANRTRLDVIAAAKSLAAPYLVIHGEADEAVPASEAELLVAASGIQGTLVLIEGAGHTFGAVHPFEGSNHRLERVLNLSIGHFEHFLVGG